MKRSYPKILSNRKRRIQRRMDPGHGWSDQAKPIMRASNIDDEMAEKARAVNCGGIGAIHLMVNKLGLRQEIESRLHLLKKHLPYHDSDHVLNLIYNALLEGVRFSSIKSDTFSLSPTASITPRSKSSFWPTGAAIRRTSSSSSKMESISCACQWTIC